MRRRDRHASMQSASRTQGHRLRLALRIYRSREQDVVGQAHQRFALAARRELAQLALGGLAELDGAVVGVFDRAMLGAAAPCSRAQFSA